MKSKENKKENAFWAICAAGIPFMYQVCDDKYLM